jgi:hypothetical protein
MLRRKKGLILVGFVFILFILFINEVHAQGILDVAIQLEKKDNDFLKGQKDLIDFANSFMRKNANEAQICLNLSQTVSESREILNASVKLLAIYSLITNEKNKELIVKIIIVELKRYVELFNNKISYINRSLTITESPAIVTTANRLKDEIREVIGLLDSVKLQ